MKVDELSFCQFLKFVHIVYHSKNANYLIASSLDIRGMAGKFVDTSAIRKSNA